MICPYPVAITNPVAEAPGFFDRMHVGCGKCGACLSNRRSEWTFRIQQEAKHSKTCYFTTLTYHDSMLHYTDNYLPNLNKRDVQLFNKSLRKKQAALTDQKYRFFCVGEYGTKYGRPHYHIIFFNLHPDLAKPDKLLWTWKNGLVHNYPLDKGLTHYATKYHVTADNRSRHLDILDDRANEFTMASNKPEGDNLYGGIGYQYIETHKKYHLSTGNAFVTNNGFKQRMPRYYYRHIFTDLSDREKEKMREEAEKLIRETEEKEIIRLKKLGFNNPYKEYLRRLAYSSKDVMFKAKKKGLF